MGVPDVAAVLLTSRRADGQLGVLRLDDALPVEILADLVPGPRQAGAVQDDGGRAADPAPKRRQLVEESVVLGGDVFLVDDELHARHRIVLSGTRDGPRPQRSDEWGELSGTRGQRQRGSVVQWRQSVQREGFMDATTEFLSDYAHRLGYADLSPEAVHQVKRTLVDTLGCAAGAFDGEPAAIALRVASRVQGDPAARILGSSQTTSTDFAAFANTVLVRYLDCNDTYAARGTGHPSDMIPAVLAVADGHRADGRAAITAIVVAYEAFCRLADTVPLKGWDQGMFVAIGAACGAGKILGLDRVEVGNAISIAITSGVPLGVTRIGELSMWKGCATAAAVRTGVFSAWLAAEGMTGPGAAFEGRDGLWQHLGVEAPKWARFGGRGEPFRITGTSFKAYPSVIHTQGPIGLVLQLRQQVAPDQIESVRVATDGEAVRRAAAGAEEGGPAARGAGGQRSPD